MNATPNIILINPLNSNSFWFQTQAYVVFDLADFATVLAGFLIIWVQMQICWHVNADWTIFIFDVYLLACWALIKCVGADAGHEWLPGLPQ